MKELICRMFGHKVGKIYREPSYFDSRIEFNCVRCGLMVSHISGHAIEPKEVKE